MTASTKILLFSSSRVGDAGFLAHAREPIAQALSDGGEVVFVPYALADWKGYTEMVADALGSSGVAVRGLHTVPDPIRGLEQAGAVFVGGGNTFRLLATLEDLGVLPVLRSRAGRDLAYIGSSAGTNLACPTIRTTNDMPIVQPTSFTALGLIPFQINPHFIAGNPVPGHRGETREERIAQFHEVADTPVVGLPEACWLEVSRGADASRATVRGSGGVVLFQRGTATQVLAPGATLVANFGDVHVHIEQPIDLPNKQS